MDNTLGKKETKELLEKFYKKCEDFWERDLGKRGTKEEVKSLALTDIKNLENNPFDPNGATLNKEAKEEFIKNK